MIKKVIVHCERICVNNINELCNIDEIIIKDNNHYPCSKYVWDKIKQREIWSKQDAKRRYDNK